MVQFKTGETQQFPYPHSATTEYSWHSEFRSTDYNDNCCIGHSSAEPLHRWVIWLQIPNTSVERIFE